MSGQQAHHHRSTLKQKNKSFKSRHASKGTLKQAAKGQYQSDEYSERSSDYNLLLLGRQESTTSRASSHKSSPFSAQNAAGSGQARRNLAKQQQMQKKAALVQASRIFRGTAEGGVASSGTGLGKGMSSSSSGGAPRIVVVCTLTQDANSWDAIKQLQDEGEEGGVRPVPGRSFEEAQAEGSTFVELDLTRHRTTLQLHPVPYGALFPLLDACKAADFVLLLLSSSSSIEAGSWGELAMRSLQAQGLPTVMACTPTLSNGQGSKRSKATTEIRKSLLSFTQYFAPEVEKVYSLDEQSEKSALLRTMATSSPRRVAWRDFRSWLISEEAEWTSSTEDGERGLLKVKGWARGAPLSANRLVHLPDFGDFPVDKITAAPLGRRQHQNGGLKDVDMATEEEEMLDQYDHEIADDLISENSINDLDNEQTWPTQDEMDQGQAHVTNGGGVDLPPALPGTTPKSISKDKTKRKDMRYDANWIKELDEEDQEGSQESDEDSGIETGDEEVSSGMGDMPIQEVDDDDDNEDDEFDDEYEAKELAQYKEQMEREKARRKEESGELHFPDEVDTPLEIPARVRFARYRGLKSFRTSPWDAYEDLPVEYARIFQFDDFKKTRRRVEASAMEEGVHPGVRVCLWIRDVPKEAAIRARDSKLAASRKSTLNDVVPFVLFGLLRHEHKKSVLNFTISRNTEYEGAVRSKDPLILCLGPRRLRVNPIFSQHDIGNNGKNGSNNVHKFERYLKGGTGVVSVATIFGPVTFGGSNVSATLFKERKLDLEIGYDQRGIGSTQMPHLIGMGSLLDADPSRIIAKRIILTGHPYKIHKRTSTIRFMFFNPEDVRYYSPLELRTKYGRVGHIQESLGTHGYFKAHFDGPPLSQIDTVSLPLYKRSYPKFSQLYTESRQEMPLIQQGDEAVNNETVDDVEMA
jgi:pre-rRNA-processing protein TSR1